MAKFRDAAAAVAGLRSRLANFTTSEVSHWMNWFIEDFERYEERAMVSSDASVIPPVTFTAES